MHKEGTKFKDIGELVINLSKKRLTDEISKESTKFKSPEQSFKKAKLEK